MLFCHELVQAQGTGTILLQNVTLIDGTGSVPQKNMDILIKDDRIVKIDIKFLNRYLTKLT